MRVKPSSRQRAKSSQLIQPKGMAPPAGKGFPAALGGVCGVGVAVAVLVGMLVGVGVAMLVGVGVGVAMLVGVGVGLGPGAVMNSLEPISGAVPWKGRPTLAPASIRALVELSRYPWLLEKSGSKDSTGPRLA